MRPTHYFSWILLVFLTTSCSDDPVRPGARLSPGEAERLAQMFNMGHTATLISEQLTAAAVTALSFAREEGGRLTGTITVTDQEWTYANTPAPRLRIESPYSPPWEIQTDEFAPGNLGLIDFFNGHAFEGDLRCSIMIEGRLIRLTSRSEQILDVPIQTAIQPENVSYEIEFTRVLQGNIQTESGDILTLNIVHYGYGLVGLGLFLESQVVGQVFIDDMRVDIREFLRDNVACNWEMDLGHTGWFTNQENFATVAGDTYTWNNVMVQGYQSFQNGCLRPPTVQNPELWIAQGSLTKNDEAFAVVVFERPVQVGTAGPRAMLKVGETQVLLRTPGVTYQPPAVIPHPFWKVFR